MTDESVLPSHNQTTLHMSLIQIDSHMEERTGGYSGPVLLTGMVYF